MFHCIVFPPTQECDPDFAVKVQAEKFRWHNFQWLEIMTGQALYEEEEEEDEDYLDPRYLHVAEELYEDPELYYEMQSQLESAHGALGPGGSGLSGEGEDPIFFSGTRPTALGYGGAGVAEYALDGNPRFTSDGRMASEYLSPYVQEERSAQSYYGDLATASYPYSNDPRIDAREVMLLSSAQDPLAMYNVGGGGLRTSVEFDYSGEDTHLQPALGTQPQRPMFYDDDDYIDHPAFTVMQRRAAMQLQASGSTAQGPVAKPGF